MGGWRERRPWDTANTTFDLGSLVSNPNFDFINSFTVNPDSDLPPNHPNSDFTSNPYTESTFSTTYIDPSDYSKTYNSNSNLKLMTLNIQSLQSKYSELRDLILTFNNGDCLPDVLALQEIWQVDDADHFPLPGYQPLIFKTRSTGGRGGGRHLSKKRTCI